MSRQHMSEMFQIQAAACHALGSPFYGVLLQRIAKDILQDGPSASVLAGHEDDPGPSALALRLMGAAHYLVLTGEAPDLAAHYPSVGGDGDPVAAWPALRDLMRMRPLELAGRLHHPPQTNEVGRAAALFGTLLQVAGPEPLPVRLNEIGCSGGLNLRADRFRYRSADGRTWGPMSPVELDPAWATAPVDVSSVLTVVERNGVDAAPIDPTTDDGAARLTSFVWPDQLDRIERLRGAILIAGQYPAHIEAGSAADFLNRLELKDGHLTVVWHSVMLQYVEPAEKVRIAARIAEIGASATAEAPFVHISFEPRRLTELSMRRYLMTAELYPGREHRLLGEAAPHGMPVHWGELASELERPTPDGPQWPIGG